MCIRDRSAGLRAFVWLASAGAIPGSAAFPSPSRRARPGCLSVARPASPRSAKTCAAACVVAGGCGN
eukprot:4888560-Alexandrium_andersonii.AAC.1